jgi:hypothetical protein
MGARPPAVTHIHACTYARTRARTHTYTQTYPPTHTHTLTHTQTTLKHTNVSLPVVASPQPFFTALRQHHTIPPVPHIVALPHPNPQPRIPSSFQPHIITIPYHPRSMSLPARTAHSLHHHRSHPRSPTICCPHHLYYLPPYLLPASISLHCQLTVADQHLTDAPTPPSKGTFQPPPSPVPAHAFAFHSSPPYVPSVPHSILTQCRRCP